MVVGMKTRERFLIYSMDLYEVFDSNYLEKIKTYVIINEAHTYLKIKY